MCVWCVCACTIHVYINMYTYKYTYVHIHVRVYIYIYTRLYTSYRLAGVNLDIMGSSAATSSTTT